MSFISAISPPDSMTIGDAAEHLFDGWAIDARFGNEPFTRDRHGVDRWFELRSHPELAHGAGLDSLPPDVRGYVQIKGTVDANRACPVSLANWRRFVELNEPCFFVGVVMSGDLRPLRAHVVHVGEKLIGRALRALRGMGPNDADTLHKRKLTVAWSADSALLEPAGASFVERIREIVGDPRAYAARKTAWRDRVGYAELSHRLVVRIEATVDDIARATVGDTDLAAEVVSHTNVRFGIERPVPGGIPPGKVWLHFDRNAGRDAELRIRGASSGVTLLGKTRSPLLTRRLPPDKQFARFSTAGLAVDLVGRNFASMAMRHEGLARPDEPRSLRALADASRVIALLEREDSCEVELFVDRHTYLMRSQRSSPAPKESGPFLLDLATFEWALLAAREAGVPDETLVVPGRILRQQRQFCMWAAHLGATRADVQIGVPIDEHAGGPACVSMLCIAEIGDRIVVQNVAFRDEQPQHEPDGMLYLRANALSRSPARMLTKQEAASFDPLAVVQPHVAQFADTKDQVLIQSTESIAEAWARHAAWLRSSDVPRMPGRPKESRRRRKPRTR